MRRDSIPNPSAAAAHSTSTGNVAQLQPEFIAQITSERAHPAASSSSILPLTLMLVIIYRYIVYVTGMYFCRTVEGSFACLAAVLMAL